MLGKDFELNCEKCGAALKISSGKQSLEYKFCEMTYSREVDNSNSANPAGLRFIKLLGIHGWRGIR